MMTEFHFWENYPLIAFYKADHRSYILFIAYKTAS